MTILALSALLLAGPSFAQPDAYAVPRPDERTACGGALAAYHAAKSVATLEPLFSCYDQADNELRAFILKGIITREIWDDPRFGPAAYGRLKALAAAGQREKDFGVHDAAFSLDWWLHNFETYRDQKARDSKAAQQRAEEQEERDSQRGRLSLSFIFGAGIVLQIFLFLANSPPEGRLLKIGFAALFGLFGLFPGKHERNYQLHFHVCYCFVLYAIMIFISFKDEIMARVSEASLLVNSLIFWYLCVSFFNHGTVETTFFALAALPTLGTLLVAFTIRDWSFPVRLSCYVWFLVLMVAISCFQVRFGDLSFIWSNQYAPPKPLNLFLTGMAFTYLVASLFYIYILIPLAGKNETQEHRMITWRQDAHQMASNFADYEMTASEALTILVFQGGLYALNYAYRWAAVPLTVNFSMIALPLVFRLLFALKNRIFPDAQASS